MEESEVDILVKEMREKGEGILKEKKKEKGIEIGRMMGKGEQKERIISKSEFKVVVIEIRRGIDDREIEVMELEIVNEDMNILKKMRE